jgi:glycosyltransferase involved in cell wall biosynthesis
MKRRIALITDGGGGKFGGGDIATTQLALALHDLGFEVGIAPLYPGFVAEEMRYRCGEKVGSFFVVPDFVPPHSLYGRVPLIGRRIERLFRLDPNRLPWPIIRLKRLSLQRWLAHFKPDLGHIQWAGGVTMGLIAYQAFAKLGIPIIETLLAEPPGSGRTTEAEQLDLLRYNARYCTAVSQAAMTRFSQRYHDQPPPPCEVVYLGTDFSDLQKRSLSALEDASGHRYDPANFVRPAIMIAGHVDEQKGARVLVHAARLLKQQGLTFSVWVLGDGPLRATLIEETRALGIDDIVHFVGFVANQVPWYANTDIYTQCSIHSEGLPLVICEAMSFGKAVIATDIGGAREIVHDGETGLLIPANDPVVLADTLKRLITDPILRHRLSQASKKLMQENFQYEKAIQCYVDIYHRVGW